MAKESCDNCKFYQEAGGGNGVCRRYPATVIVHPAAVDKDGHPLFACGFPSMNGKLGWCGEYERQLIINPNHRQQ